jgi:hypothetical protein
VTVPAGSFPVYPVKSYPATTSACAAAEIDKTLRAAAANREFFTAFLQKI